MAKYKKSRKSATRTKKKTVFSTPLAAAATPGYRSFVDALAQQELVAKLQAALEAERDDIVGRSWHEHHQDRGTPREYRNGYGKPRNLTCGVGTVQIQLPRLRRSFESNIVTKYDRLTPALQQLLPQLYLHGLATGDFQPSLGWLLGEDAPLSSSTIVRLKEQWEHEYQGWKERSVEEEYLYLWCDGIYPKGGPIDETLAVLVVVGITRRGEKKLLALEEGYRESEESWIDLFQSLKKRGVKWVGLVIGDGMQGLWKAVRRVFPLARHQRCWVHKMRNILDKVPKHAHDEVLDYLRQIYNASSEKEAQRLKEEFIRRYHARYPKAVQSLQEAGTMLFTYFRFPRQHWKSIKTTNPIESLFATVRLRLRAARRMRTRLSTVCLMFQLLQTCERRLNKLRGHQLVAQTIDQLKITKLRTVRSAA